MGETGATGAGRCSTWWPPCERGRLPPVAERPALLQGLANLLVQPRTSVVLLGENGVGRRSLVQALAQSLARQPLPDLPPALYAVSPAALLDGPELVIRQAIEQARGALLALPDLHQFFGAAPLTGFAEAGVALRQALLEGTLRLVGTSTPPLYTRHLEPDPALRDHLRPLTVPPTDEAETMAALGAAQPVLERDNGVTIAAGALKAAYTLSRQYLPEPQPAAAIGLLRRACALVRLSHTAFLSAPPPARPQRPATAPRPRRRPPGPTTHRWTPGTWRRPCTSRRGSPSGRSRGRSRTAWPGWRRSCTSASSARTRRSAPWPAPCAGPGPASKILSAPSGASSSWALPGWARPRAPWPWRSSSSAPRTP